MSIWGAVIAGGASLLGGALAQGSSGGMSKDDRRFQERVFRNQLQWKVEDAQKAGIHPLYAMGAPSFNPSPTAVGGENLGTGVQRAGQDISRAMLANMDRRERAQAALLAAERAAREEERAAQAHGAALRESDARTQLLLSQVARANSAQVGPGAVTVQPSLTTSTAVGDRSREAAIIPERRFVRRRDGSIGIVRGQLMAEALEDDLIGTAEWQLRNNIVPRLMPGLGSPSDAELRDFGPARRGHYWLFNPWTGGYEQVRYGGVQHVMEGQRGRREARRQGFGRR